MKHHRYKIPLSDDGQLLASFPPYSAPLAPDCAFDLCVPDPRAVAVPFAVMRSELTSQANGAALRSSRNHVRTDTNDRGWAMWHRGNRFPANGIAHAEQAHRMSFPLCTALD